MKKRPDCYKTPLFVGRQNWYSQAGHIAKSDLQSWYDLHQHSNCILHQITKSNPKLQGIAKYPQIAKASLSKKNVSKGTTTSDFKLL